MIDKQIKFDKKICPESSVDGDMSPFFGKSVAITGKLDNYTRAEIEARLLELGARPTASVSRKTDYLIVGKKPGGKLAKAQMLKITILSEQDFENMAE